MKNQTKASEENKTSRSLSETQSPDFQYRLPVKSKHTFLSPITFSSEIIVYYIKGEVNAKTNLFLFESIGIVD